MDNLLSSGMSYSLVMIASFVATASLILFSRAVPPVLLAVSVFIKVGISFSYFAWFNDGQWLLVDDVYYFEVGKELVDSGFSPLDADGFIMLSVLSGGTHVMYGWFNYISQYFFGPYYYVPVFLNILLTYVSGYLLYKIAFLSGFSRKYCVGLFFFFVLHWDVLAWSSFVNLKDILVLTLSLLLFYYLLRADCRPSFFNIAMIMVIFFGFYWIRFYVPLLASFAFVIYIILNRFSLKMVKNLVLIVSFIGVSVSFIGVETITKYLNVLDLSIDSIAYGVVRMLLTPQPWNMAESYTFLTLSAWLHVIFFVPMCVGGVLLWLKSHKARLCIVYFLVAIILYASLSELQGPRHRVQLLFVTVWMQYHFLWLVLRGFTQVNLRAPIKDRSMKEIIVN